jgi:hypothetical protein
MHFCLSIASLSIFVLFTAAYVGQKYKENTLFKLPWQQWLSKREILLHLNYIAYLETQENYYRICRHYHDI